MAQGILLIIVGLAAIVFGFTASEFYPRFMRRPRPDEKPMPKWLGRTIFLMVGAGFIYSGLSQWLPIQVGAATQGAFLVVVGLATIVYDLLADRFYPNPAISTRSRSAGRIVTFIVAVFLINIGGRVVFEAPLDLGQTCPSIETGRQRAFSWLQNYRRLLVRHDRLIAVYRGFFSPGLSHGHAETLMKGLWSGKC